MTQFDTVPLSHIVTSSGRRAGSLTHLPVYSVTKHQGFVPSLEYFKKQVFSRDLSNYKVVERGEFAYATIHLDEGSIGIADTRCLISPMYTVFKVTDPNVHPRYLLRYLKSKQAIAEYSRLGKGSVHRRKAISLSALGKMRIPLPSFNEQQRIVEVLDRADELRAKRRQALAHLDELTQSIFLDMFGDPVENDRQWPQATVGDFVAGFESGKNIAAEDNNDPRAKYRVLKVSAVTSLSFKPEESKAAPVDYSPPTSHIVREGDLLFSRANTAELIGATAIAIGIPANLLLPDKLWRFVWHDVPRAHPLYVRQLFQQPRFRREIARRATGTSGSMKNISQEKVLAIRCGLPPLQLQQEFAERVSAIENVRLAQRTQLAELDALFASLQNRAFKGLL